MVIFIQDSLHNHPFLESTSPLFITMPSLSMSLYVMPPKIYASLNEEFFLKSDRKKTSLVSDVHDCIKELNTHKIVLEQLFDP